MLVMACPRLAALRFRPLRGLRSARAMGIAQASAFCAIRITALKARSPSTRRRNRIVRALPLAARRGAAGARAAGAQGAGDGAGDHIRPGGHRRAVAAGTLGSNRYQQFCTADVERAALIRSAQQLGFTLKQIAALNREYTAGAMDSGRKLAVMRSQSQVVEAQAGRIRTMQRYLRAKIAWLEGDERGAEPGFCGMGAAGDKPRRNRARRA